MRYFLMAHSLANLLLGLSSVASVAASIAGLREIQGVLLVAALLFALQAAVTWSALQRRFKARYSLW